MIGEPPGTGSPGTAAIWEVRGVLRKAEGDPDRAAALFNEAADQYARSANHSITPAAMPQPMRNADPGCGTLARTAARTHTPHRRSARSVLRRGACGRSRRSVDMRVRMQPGYARLRRRSIVGTTMAATSLYRCSSMPTGIVGCCAGPRFDERNEAGVMSSGANNFTGGGPPAYRLRASSQSDSIICRATSVRASVSLTSIHRVVCFQVLRLGPVRSASK
jgi:hypothetical protein